MFKIKANAVKGKLKVKKTLIGQKKINVNGFKIIRNSRSLKLKKPIYWIFRQREIF